LLGEGGLGALEVELGVVGVGRDGLVEEVRVEQAAHLLARLLAQHRAGDYRKSRHGLDPAHRVLAGLRHQPHPNERDQHPQG
jgi:hypothetical protein